MRPFHLLAAAGLAAAAPPALDAQVSDTVPRGTIVGVVLDAGTGTPLVGAVVVLEPAPGGVVAPAASGSAFWSRGRNAMTNSQGAYRFDDVSAGSYRLLVRRLGYRPAMVELEIRRTGALRISVGLEVRPVLLEPERVVAPAVPFIGAGSIEEELRGARLDLELHRQRTYAATDVRMLTSNDVSEAVTLGETDLFRAFHRLPGVTTRDDFTAELWTRGAPWSHTRVYFDGLPLFNPVHTVGVFSGLNPDAVGSVVFHPGVRSAALGEGAAAALEVQSRRPPSGLQGGAELSVLSARSTLGAGGSGGGVTVAARRSYLDLVNAADLLFDSAVGAVPYAFFDVSARGDVRLGRAALLEVSGLWERDDIGGDVGTFLRDTQGHWGNAAARVSLSAPLGSWFTRHTVGATRFDGRLRQSALLQRGTELAPAHQPTDNALRYVTVGSRVEPGSGWWAAGWEFVRQRQDYAGAPPRPYPQAVIRDSLTIEESMSIPVLWGEVRVERGPVRIVTGLRAEFPVDVMNASAALAPRVMVRWTLDARTAMSAAYGRSYQYTQALAPAGPGVGPELYVTDVWLLAGDTVPAIRSDVASAGIERWLGEAWLGAVNVYARHATGIAEPWPEPGPVSDARPLFAAASNDAAGLEVSARRLAGRWTGSVAYSLGVSRMSARGLTFPSATERRHVLDATAMVRLGRAVRVGGAFTAASGSPYTRFTVDPILCDSAFAGGCGEDVMPGDTLGLTAQDIELPGAERTRAYVALDLIAEWSRDFGGWRLGAWVQLRNALNARNAVTYLGTYDDCSPGPDDVLVGARCDRFERGLPLLPLVGVSVAF